MTKDQREEIKQSLKAAKAQLDTKRAQIEETSARIEKRVGRNLFFAVGSGLLFGAIFVLALFLAKPIFALLVGALVSLAAVELAIAFRGKNLRVPRVGIVAGSLFVVLGAYFYGAFGMLTGLACGLATLTIWRLVEGLVPKWGVSFATLVRDVFSGLFVLIYTAFLGSIAILLVQADRGEFWVFTLVATVVSADVGAYAAGVSFGKHKMTPNISPNKTWEGFAGGLLATTITATALTIFMLHQPWWVGIIMGILILLTATLGDLTESLIKRNLGVKDMSSWIPGHGGFLDRLDSILPSTVPVYAVALLVGVV